MSDSTSGSNQEKERTPDLPIFFAPTCENPIYESTISTWLNDKLGTLYEKFPENTHPAISAAQIMIVPRLQTFEKTLQTTKASHSGTVLEKIKYRLELLESQTGIPSVYVGVSSAMIGSLIILRLLKPVLVNVAKDAILFGYPAWKTLQGIDRYYSARQSQHRLPSNDNNYDSTSDNDDIQWKSYWILYSLLQLLEKRFKGILLFVPFRKNLVLTIEFIKLGVDLTKCV